MLRLASSFAVLVLVGCKGTIEAKYAEDFLSSTLEKWTGQKPTAVKCPAEVRKKRSAGFHCTASFRETGTAVADIGLVQTDGTGGLALASLDGLLFAADLEGRIARRFAIRLKTNLVIDCGPRVRLPVAGGEFFCNARDEKGESRTILVTMTNDRGGFTFGTELSPAAPAPQVPAP